MSENGNLPNLIIIGAAKTGTTSLHFYLNQHPDIFMSRVKELRYFIDRGNWRRGVDWYRSKFPVAKAVRGEASPQYSYYPRIQRVPERMVKLLPDAKIVYLVRDPLQRIISHYIQHNIMGKETRSLNDTVREFEKSWIVTASRYAFQLGQYLPHYPAQRILVIRSDNLRNDRAQTLRQVFNFLGVRADFQSTRFQSVKHVTASKRALNPAGQKIWVWIDRFFGGFHSGLTWRMQRTLTRPFSLPQTDPPKLDNGLKQELIAYLREDADQFSVLTGIDTSDWMLAKEIKSEPLNPCGKSG